LKRKEEEGCQGYEESVQGRCRDPNGDGMNESNVMSEEDEAMEKEWDYESVYSQGKEETMNGTFEIYEDEEGEEDCDDEQNNEAEKEEESAGWDEWSDAETRASDSSSSSSDCDESDESEESEASPEINAVCSLACHEKS
jgi:hypothetical protein